MFLRSLSNICTQLGYPGQAEDYLAALHSIVTATDNTNTMMWVGTMADCPLDLSRQGQLLKHGPVNKRPGSIKCKKGRAKWSSMKLSSFHLILFQQTAVLCRSCENSADRNNPLLFYSTHIRWGIYIHLTLKRNNRFNTFPA